jgi:hypothetical protein
MSVSDDELREMALEGNVEAIDTLCVRLADTRHRLETQALGQLMYLEQRNELREALAHAVTQVRDLHNNWPESDLHEPVRATLDRAKPLVPEAFE